MQSHNFLIGCETITRAFMANRRIASVLFSLALFMQALLPVSSSLAMGGSDSTPGFLCRLLHGANASVDRPDLTSSPSDHAPAQRGSHHDHRSCPVCQSGAKPALLDFLGVQLALPVPTATATDRPCQLQNLVEIRFAGAALPRAPPSFA
jgi:hypothetical protein